MCMDSGMWEKKSMMRQPSWMCVFGLGFSACTMSGNFMPSRMKNTGKLLPTCRSDSELIRAGLPESLQRLRAASHQCLCHI